MFDTEKQVDKEVNMDVLTEGENFPEVKENAIAAVKETRETAIKEQKQAELTAQAQGVKLKKDGTPAKKRGRKSAAEIQTNPAAPKDNKFYNPNEKTSALPPGQVQVSSLYAAQVTSNIIEQATVKLISNEFTLNEMERATNIKAWQDCYDHYGGVSLTPPQALILSHLSIIGSRMVSGKETRSKFALIGAWIKTKWHAWRNKNALSNNRKNAQREDDIRKEESGKPEKTGKTDNRS